MNWIWSEIKSTDYQGNVVSDSEWHITSIERVVDLVTEGGTIFFDIDRQAEGKVDLHTVKVKAVLGVDQKSIGAVIPVIIVH